MPSDDGTERKTEAADPRTTRFAVALVSGAVVLFAVVNTLICLVTCHCPSWLLPSLAVALGLLILPAWAHMALYYWRVKLLFKDAAIDRSDESARGVGAREGVDEADVTRKGAPRG